MPQVYRYKRTHVYYYEVVANDVKTANEQVRRTWAGSYKDMKLSDYELVKTSKFEAKPVITAEPEVEVEPKAVVKPAAKKAAKKVVKKQQKKPRPRSRSK